MADFKDHKEELQEYNKTRFYAIWQTTTGKPDTLVEIYEADDFNNVYMKMKGLREGNAPFSGHSYFFIAYSVHYPENKLDLPATASLAQIKEALQEKGGE